MTRLWGLVAITLLAALLLYWRPGSHGRWNADAGRSQPSRVAVHDPAAGPRWAGRASFAPRGVTTLRCRGGTLTDLGSLGGSVWALGVNDAGEVVGQSRRGSLAAAYRFAGTEMVALGNLPGGTVSIANGINNSGQIAGGADTSNGASHAFLFQGGLRDLGTLGGTSSQAFAVNEHGQVIGASDVPDNRSQHAFRWTDGRMEDLGTLGGEHSMARAVNDAGEVVGSSWLAGNVILHAFCYRGDTMRDLGTLGGSQSEARGINAAGEIVGWADTVAGLHHAFLRRHGRMIDLGTLGGASSEAFGLNAGGEVVGRASTVHQVPHAFLWKEGTMTDLNALLPLGSGWALREACAINRSGQIVGSGNVHGTRHAFLLTWDAARSR